MAVFAYENRVELSDHLLRMRIELQSIERALASGDAEARSYSDGAPRSAPESGRWNRTIEGLHHQLLEQQNGWERSDPLNLPTWLHPDQKIAVVVSSGDSNTGTKGFKNPSTRNPKGSSFGSLVEVNGQEKIFDLIAQSGDFFSPKETWVLLYHARQGFVFSELSLPIEMAGPFIKDWKHRILLPKFDPGTGVFEGADGATPPNQDFNFQIHRR